MVRVRPGAGAGTSVTLKRRVWQPLTGPMLDLKVRQRAQWHRKRVCDEHAHALEDTSSRRYTSSCSAASDRAADVKAAASNHAGLPAAALRWVPGRIPGWCMLALQVAHKSTCGRMRMRLMDLRAACGFQEMGGGPVCSPAPMFPSHHIASPWPAVLLLQHIAHRSSFNAHADLAHSLLLLLPRSCCAPQHNICVDCQLHADVVQFSPRAVALTQPTLSLLRRRYDCKQGVN